MRQFQATAWEVPPLPFSGIFADALGAHLMVLRGLAAGDLVYGLCCPLPVKLQTPQGTV